MTEAIDTTTPGGRLIFCIFGMLGQFERDLIGERTGAGLGVAPARGRKGGRKPVITDDKLKRACDGRQGPHRARDRNATEGGKPRVARHSAEPGSPGTPPAVVKSLKWWLVTRLLDPGPNQELVPANWRVEDKVFGG